MPTGFDPVLLYGALNEFIIYYYLAVEAVVSDVTLICSVDDIDLEADRHRGLRVHASEHAIIGPSTGNHFFHGVTAPLGRRID